MTSTENRDRFTDIKKGLRDYIEQRLTEFPVEPNREWPDIEETKEIPLIHDEIASIQFYRIGLSPAGNDHLGMRLNHHSRVTSQSEEGHNITTDLDFTDPQSHYDGTYTR